jgi:hypothetical protein
MDRRGFFAAAIGAVAGCLLPKIPKCFMPHIWSTKFTVQKYTLPINISSDLLIR